MTIIQAQPLKQFGISGPASALDNEVPVFDGVTGKKIKAATGITSPSSGRLKMSSTAPYLTLHNTAHEDTDYGRESELIFKGEQSGGEETTLGKIQVAHDGTSDDQKGIMSFKVNDGTDGDVPTTAMTILANGNVGIGTANPNYKLETVGKITAHAPFFGDTGLITYGDNGMAMALAVGSGASAFLFDNAGRFGIQARTRANVISGAASGDDEKLTVLANGRVGIHDITPSRVLDIKGIAGDDPFVVHSSGGANFLCVEESGSVGVMTEGDTIVSKLQVGKAFDGYDAFITIAGGRGGGANLYAGLDFRNYDEVSAYTGARIGSRNDNGVSDGNLEFYIADAGSLSVAANMIINSSGNIGIGTTAPSVKLDINSDIIRLRTAKTPASAGAAGNQGDECWDADYHYRCVATNTWKRTAITTW